MEKRQTFTERFDWTLCLILFLFFLISCLSIYSAQTTGQYSVNFVALQIRWYVVCSIIIAIIINFDPDQFKKMTWYLYGLGVIFLLILFIVPGSTASNALIPIRNNAQSWFQIPGVGLIQPSEFMKTFLILALSKVTVQHHEKTKFKTVKTDMYLLLKLGIITFIPLAFIIKQPDLGTALVIIAIFLGITLVSGITWKILLPMFGSAAAIGSTLILLVLYFPDLLEILGFHPYQFKRIYSWLQPEDFSGGDAFQLEQSLSAIGSGMMIGKGFSEGTVYIPEAHSDFIYSVIGEDWGFLGGSIVIGLYFILIYHLTKIALSATDPFISYICTGVISTVTFHVFQNIGMTIQVLPITGIPLPFISYGGSSLMGNMLAMGIIFSIQYYNKPFMFSRNRRAS